MSVVQVRCFTWHPKGAFRCAAAELFGVLALSATRVALLHPQGGVCFVLVQVKSTIQGFLDDQNDVKKQKVTVSVGSVLGLKHTGRVSISACLVFVQVNELVQVETYLRSEGLLVRYWYPIEMLERPPAGSRRTAANGLVSLDSTNIQIHR